MTLCPVAIAVGCPRCPVFKICSAKGVIGSSGKQDPAAAEDKPKSGEKKG